MEKLTLRRAIAAGTAAAVGALVFTGCASGKADAPSMQDIRRDAEYMELARPDGMVMDCVYYGKSGEDGYAGFSWLVLDCDWDNPHEVTQQNQPNTASTTTTTIPQVVPPTVDRLG